MRGGLRAGAPVGTLVVEINDAEVEARFRNGKLVLLGLDGKERYTLAPICLDPRASASKSTSSAFPFSATPLTPLTVRS